MIHPTAIVDPGAKIGANVEIGPYTLIGPNVEIGDNTVIGPHCVIRGHTRIGRDNRIFQFCSLGEVPQDKKYAGEPTRLEIGDRNTIREYCTFNLGTVQDAGVTRMGDDNWIMAYVHVAHDCAIGNNVILGNACQIAGEVKIDDWAIVSGGTLIHQFCHVGSHVIVQGGSRIGKDIPPFITAGRDPISYAGVNSIGLRRRGFTNEQICDIQNIYRLLFLSGLNTSQAIERIEAELPATKEKDEVILFLRNSQRGIIKGYFDK